MKCRTLAQIALALFSLAFLASIFFPVFRRGEPPGSRAICRSNLMQMGLSVAQYVQDYDERLPLLSVNAVATSLAPYAMPYGWADGIQPYLKNVQILKCPKATHPLNVIEDGVVTNFTDYYLNTDLGGIEAKRLVWPAATILFGEGNDGSDLTDARYNRNSLPLAWLQDKTMPSFRHLGGANYIFADGHVKYLQPDKIMPTLRPRADAATFALN